MIMTIVESTDSELSKKKLILCTGVVNIFDHIFSGHYRNGH